MLFLSSRSALAKEPSRPPLPESILTESTTDIDAEEAGEVEYELNVATVAAQRGGARALLTSVEVEWRLGRELGVRFEPSYAHLVSSAAPAEGVFGANGALALGLLHDFPRDFHLQAEILARTSEGATELPFEPGETELPVAADLVAAKRYGRWTLRATAGGEVGGTFVHAPLHTDVALLTGFVSEERFGFLAIDLRADWARQAPIVVAPEFVADATSLGLPFRLGVALPVNLNAEPTRPSYGIFVRLTLLTGREAEYGRTGGRE